MRLFAAVFVEQKAANAIFEYFYPLVKSLNSKPVSPEKLHITLNFFGEADAVKCIELCEKAVAGCGKFEIAIKHLGCFIRTERSGVLWAGAYDKNGMLPKLALKTGNSEGQFTPHITLARFKNNSANKDILKNQIAEYSGKNEVLSFFTAAKLALVESFLSREGALYKVVKEFYLI